MDFKTVITTLIKRFRRGRERELTPLSPSAEKEFQKMARSESFRKDVETVLRNRHSPFIRKDGRVDADAYITKSFTSKASYGIL